MVLLRPEYDLVIQSRLDVMRDAQRRAIDASPLSNLVLTSPISRVIAQSAPPFQMKAHWAAPRLDINNDFVNLSAEVRGGLRHMVEGINLTMTGKVSASCRVRLAVADDGLPTATLSPPSPFDLDLADLRLSYAGGNEPYAWADRAVDEVFLRPVLAGLLMAPLAGLPLSYVPASLRLHTTGSVEPAWGVFVDSNASLLAVAKRGDISGTVTMPPPCLLPKDMPGNAAVAISQQRMNATLHLLCTRGLGTGTTHVNLKAVPWQWIQVAVNLADATVGVAGRLRYDDTVTPVDATLRCWVADSGQLSVQLIGHALAPPDAMIVTDALASLLRQIFCPGPPPEHADGLPQYEHFSLAGIYLSTVAPIVDVAVQGGYLIARYAMKLDN